MAVSITNQTALITGASRGIGKQCALALAREGCRLALTARDEAKLNAVAAECRGLGAEIHCIPADLLEPGAVERIVDETVLQFDGLNILVNNAGVFFAGAAGQADPAELDLMLDLNLKSVIRLTNAALPHIIHGAQGEAGRGAVIFIASMSAVRTYPGGGGYCASKFGVLGYSKAVWDDVADLGIKVTAICPGWVNTDMAADSGLDVTKMIQPEDLAELVRMAATWPGNSCPREIHVLPQGHMRAGMS